LAQAATPSTSAATRAKRFAKPSAQPGRSCFFLPKYSPDLNPIEQVFATLKHLLRKAAARTLETVVAATGELLGAYTQRARQLLRQRRIWTDLKTSRPSSV
jgi:transposase